MSMDKHMDSQDFSQMDIFKIMKRLPHRYPFLLIDRVLDVEMPNKRLRALKNVTINEPFFPGHFPHRPVMPGVLLLEAMAQASSLLLSFPGTDDDADNDTIYYFAGIDNARFKRPVIAGDQVIIDVVSDRSRGGIYKFSGTASVDGELSCQAEWMCAIRKIED